MFNIIHGSEKNGHISRHGLEVDVRRGGDCPTTILRSTSPDSQFLVVEVKFS